MAITKEQFQQRLNSKFSNPEFKVLDFNGLRYPVKILCPLHGEQAVSTANNLVNSRKGCPACGRDAAVTAGVAAFRSRWDGHIKPEQHVRFSISILSLLESDFDAESLKLKIQDLKQEIFG